MAVTLVEIVVRSTDIGADGHVTPAMYLNFIEQARLEHLRRAGLQYRPEAADFAVAAASIEFVAPSFYPDVLVVGARTSQLGRSSFRLDYEVNRRADRAAICRGASTQVWLGGQGRPTPIPDWLRKGLAPDGRAEPDYL